MEQLCRAQPLPSVPPAIPEGQNCCCGAAEHHVCPSLSSLKASKARVPAALHFGRTHIPVLARAAELRSGPTGAQSTLSTLQVPPEQGCAQVCAGVVCRWPAGPAGAEHPWVPPVPALAVLLPHTRNHLCHGATKALLSLPGCV